MNGEIKLVVFDLFGTLIRMSVKQHPFRKIFKFAKGCGRKPRGDDARTLMTTDELPENIFKQMGIDVTPKVLEAFYRELEQELNALTLFDGVIPVLEELNKRGLNSAICSN